jgi:hypothetical protein
MNTLIFHVKGSAKDPYRIIAEGEGQELRAFCSCPAGRKGCAFCKHIAYLLQGDIGKLVSPSTADVNELARRAIGSALLEKAGIRVDRDMRHAEASGLHSLDEVFTQFKPELEGLGWTLRIVKNDGDRDEDHLELYATFKNGNLRKTPSITFEFVRNDYDYPEDFDLSEWGQDLPDTPATLRPRERPWGIRTTGGKSVGRTWKHIVEPLPMFLELARRGPAAKF